MNHWKTVIVSLAVVIITGVATGLVLARWYGPDIARLDVRPSKTVATRLVDAPSVAELPPRTTPSRISDSPAASPAMEPAVSSVPPKSVTEACDQVALRESGADVTTKTTDRKYRASYASCLKSRGYTI